MRRGPSSSLITWIGDKSHDRTWWTQWLTTHQLQLSAHLHFTLRPSPSCSVYGFSLHHMQCDTRLSLSLYFIIPPNSLSVCCNFSSSSPLYLEYPLSFLLHQPLSLSLSPMVSLLSPCPLSPTSTSPSQGNMIILSVVSFRMKFLSYELDYLSLKLHKTI